MLTDREKLADELAGIMYKQADCDDDNTWLESRKFHFVADQILFYLQAKDYLLPQLQQCDVSRSADIEEPKVIVYNAETERAAKEQWTNCRKIDAVKTIMQMGYSLKDAKTFCERHFG